MFKRQSSRSVAASATASGNVITNSLHDQAPSRRSDHRRHHGPHRRQRRPLRAEATTAPEPPKQSPEDGEDEQPTTHATANASREPHTNQHSDCGHDQIAGPDAVATSLCTERSTRFSRGKRLAIRNTQNGYPIVLKNRDRGHKYEL